MKRLAALCAAAVLLAACEHPGAIDDYGFDVDLDFTSKEAPPGVYFPIPEVTVTAGAGEVLVEGWIATPTPCHRLRGSADGEARYVDLTVRIEAVGPACIGSLGSFAYTARAKGLAPGEYVLRLRHDYPGTEGDPPVREYTVTVH